MKIVGYIVQSRNGVYGPFHDGSEAGLWLEHHCHNLAGPASIVPIMEPMPILRPTTEKRIKSSSSPW